MVTTWTSHELLQPACVQWIFAQTGARPWFPGELRDATLPAHAGVLDVVLFGDFVDQLTRFKAWPQREYRLWVLSRAVKGVCVDVLGFSASEIGVIDRYDLFPLRRGSCAFPRREGPYALIYSGRLTSVKNFDVFLRLASRLQTEHGHTRMRPIAYGEYPQNAREDTSIHFDFLQLHLPWRTPPRIVHGLGPNEWLRDTRGAKVLMNLSRQRREDFGVSVAQAQSAGLPCILSDWGGHRDVRGANVVTVPAHLLPPEGDRTLSTPMDVARLARTVDRLWDAPNGRAGEFTPRLPRTVNRERLQKLAADFWPTLGRRTLKSWMKTAEAQDFVRAYERAFGLTR